MMKEQQTNSTDVIAFETTVRTTPLTALNYEADYYEEHKDAGLDYTGHGYWQESYGQMVTDATLQNTYEHPYMVDCGCACGSILKGFAKTNLYDSVLGVDLSKHMIELGRKTFGFSNNQLQAGSIAALPLPDESITLVHSAQVLEHIADDQIDAIVTEISRVLKPGGRLFLCLDAIRNGESREMYMGDPTHVNIQPLIYWTRKFSHHGLVFDTESYNRFVQHPNGPTQGDPRSFYQAYPSWSVFTLIKI